MGVLNVTPDSFFDGGRFHHEEPSLLIDKAVKQGLILIQEGAHYLDIGGESSRPGATPVSLEEELRRVIPVIRNIHRECPQTIISVDTIKPQVAEEALRNGASIINDIRGFRDPDMLSVAASQNAGICIMHMRGTPQTMQLGDLSSSDLVQEVVRWLSTAVERALKAGVSEHAISLDVGIGFGKTVEQNIELIIRLEEVLALGFPVLIGLSRKSMIGAITQAKVEDRLPGSIAALLEAWRRGASIFRVHDVWESVQALQVTSHLDHFSKTLRGYSSP